MTWNGLHLELIFANLLQAIEEMSRFAAMSFVSGLWQGIALAAGAALCLRLVPKTTAAVRFAVWTGVFAVLALLPLLHTYAWRGVATASEQGGRVLHVDVRWSFAIGLLWLALSLSRGVKLASGAVRLRGIWKRAVPVEANERVGSALVAARLGGAQLCSSLDVDRPSVIGFFSPRILIPTDLAGKLSSEEMEQIVMHEIGHLRRADDWMNLLQKLCLMLVPLNPILVWIEHKLCFERELACDDQVLLMTKAPKAYATCLTNLAEHRLGRRIQSLSLGVWERQSELGLRVHRILRRGEGMSRRQAQMIVGCLMLILLGGTAELSRCPQLVSFSENSVKRSVPMTMEAGSLPGAAYQPVVFHPASHTIGREPGTVHESLLKASMPRNGDGKSGVPSSTTRRHSTPSLLRLKQRRGVAQQQQRWVVLTSWSGDDVEQQRMIFTVSESRTGVHKFSSSYAAVPTGTGWLVIQL
jgi:Zn-dependent protease with chaperone function